MIAGDDKRFLPAFGPYLWTEKTSERAWHYCKYCAKDTPTFLLTEGRMGSQKPIALTRCCWECGHGLDQVKAAGIE